MISLTITNPVTQEKYNKKIDENCLDAYTGNSRPSCNILTCLVVPIRSNTMNNFVHDLFLTTLVDHAMKTRETASRVLALVAAFFVALLTLPVRLFMAIPMAMYNSFVGVHPLQELLDEDPDAPEGLTSEGYVNIRYTQTIFQDEEVQEVDDEEEGTLLSSFTEVEEIKEIYLNLISVPYYDPTIDPRRLKRSSSKRSESFVVE